MFLVSTDNRLYYRGQNLTYRGGIGTSTYTLDFIESKIMDGNGKEKDISTLVDCLECYKASYALFSDGELYKTLGSSGWVKIFDDAKQIAHASSTLIFILDSVGNVYYNQTDSISNVELTQLTVFRKNDVALENVPVIKKIGGSLYAYSNYSYGSGYLIDIHNNMYAFRNNPFSSGIMSTSNYAYYHSSNVRTGYSYVNSTADANQYSFSVCDNNIYTQGVNSGLGISFTIIQNITNDRNFKTNNTNIKLYDKNIVDVFSVCGDVVLVYKEFGELKYAISNRTTNYISGDSLSTPNNTFKEIVPNESNINFNRFSHELLIDSVNSLLYAWEKETDDLYFAGADYTTSSSVITPLTKVELPEGRKVKRLKNSTLYHNFEKTIPDNDIIVTSSMFPDGAFDSSISGFKVWNGEEYDRAIFVDELEDKYYMDVTKTTNPIKIQTSQGEKILATVNMMLSPKWIQGSQDENAIVGEAIIGKSRI